MAPTIVLNLMEKFYSDSSFFFSILLSYFWAKVPIWLLTKGRPKTWFKSQEPAGCEKYGTGAGSCGDIWGIPMSSSGRVSAETMIWWWLTASIHLNSLLARHSLMPMLLNEHSIVKRTFVGEHTFLMSGSYKKKRLVLLTDGFFFKRFLVKSNRP